MGRIRAGQVQYLRVPYGDFNALKLEEGKEHETDFVLLADIFQQVGMGWCWLGSSLERAW